MPGLWKAWKAKKRLPTLSTSPLEISPKGRRDFHISTAPATKADGKVENQKQVSHFPTAPVSLSQEQKNSPRAGLRPRPRQHYHAASVVPFSSAPLVSCYSALDNLCLSPLQSLIQRCTCWLSHLYHRSTTIERLRRIVFPDRSSRVHRDVVPYDAPAILLTDGM